MKTSENRSGHRSVILLSGYRGLAETFLSTFYQEKHALSVLVRNQSAVESLRARFPEVQFVVGDCAQEADCRRWINAAVERFGRIDVLINNAAITGPAGRWHELPFDEVRKSVEVNLLAPLFLIQLCLPHFFKHQSGLVINLSGGGATGPRPHFISYAMAKCALVRATESLAQEYPGLNFYAISPGALKTPMVEAVLQLDPNRVGPEYAATKLRVAQGGEDPRKAAELALWLVENKPKALNGKLVSALWDDYRKCSLSETEASWWTLRRVDEVLVRQIKEGML